MNRVDYFKGLVRDSRDFFEGTLHDVTPEQAAWVPAGRALPIAAQYAHVVAAQDFGLHGLLLGSAPLALGPWSGRTGMAELPPAFGEPWDGWAKQPFDLLALRAYARAVYDASDAYLARLDEAEMARTVDLTAAGFGEQTVGFVLVNGWVMNVNLHCGEIACLKGLQAAKGYPV